MIKILHITGDDKFFDGPFSKFEMDSSLKNKAYLASFGNEKLKYIKSKDKVSILRHKSNLKVILENGDYDVVFFYSLPFERWWMIECIPVGKIVIWWEWGYDLYSSREGLTPLVNVPLYKPLTEKYVRNRLRTLLINIRTYLLYKRKKEKLLEQRKRVLSRIDYLMPVLPIDYELLKKHSEFKAKIFYHNTINYYKLNTHVRSKDGGILLGNSSLVSNNHLDIWDALKRTGISNRRIIVPLNYGELDTALYMSRKIISHTNDVVVLRKFLSYKDYFNLVESCSYAVFGVMRQQAVGNIKKCFRVGIKVFLYKDSVCYKSLTASGYKVFAIEDMDLTSLTTPMTLEDNIHNVKVFENEINEKNEIYNEVMKEIQYKLNRH